MGSPKGKQACRNNRNFVACGVHSGTTYLGNLNNGIPDPLSCMTKLQISPTEIFPSRYELEMLSSSDRYYHTGRSSKPVRDVIFFTYCAEFRMILLAAHNSFLW
jgi:hypothetical protein